MLANKHNTELAIKNTSVSNAMACIATDPSAK
jgi:hypothetical protein